MAVRRQILKKKNKRAVLGRAAARIADIKNFGPEPAGDVELRGNDRGRYLNWYNYMCERSDAKEYALARLTAQNRTDIIELVEATRDPFISQTAGWLARMADRNVSMPDIDVDDKIEQFIREAHAASERDRRANETIVIGREKPRKSSSDVARDRAGEMCAFFEEGPEFLMFDPTFSVREYLVNESASVEVCAHLIVAYKGWFVELLTAYEGKDADLKEAYSRIPRAALKARLAAFSKFLGEIDAYRELLENKPVVRKPRQPRKPKPVSVEKKLQHFRYQKNSSEYDGRSFDPAKILGARELWTFNTKYKILTVFKASSDSGLDIHRSSIVGYDESTSRTMRAGRRSTEVFKKLASLPRAALNKEMTPLVGCDTIAHRINEDTLLVRIF